MGKTLIMKEYCLLSLMKTLRNITFKGLWLWKAAELQSGKAACIQQGQNFPIIRCSLSPILDHLTPSL